MLLFQVDVEQAQRHLKRAEIKYGVGPELDSSLDCSQSKRVRNKPARFIEECDEEDETGSSEEESK